MCVKMCVANIALLRKYLTELYLTYKVISFLSLSYKFHCSILTTLNSFQLLSLTTLVGGAFCFGAFAFKSMYGFLALFAIGELLVFATQVLPFSM